jgi:Na+/proline symporter
MLNFIDQSVIILFFLWIIFIGIKNVRKIENINMFAVGTRSFSTFSLFATITSTWVTGSMFFVDLSGVYFNGLKYYLPCFGMIFSIIIIGWFIAPRIKKFLGQTSIAEVIRKEYGEHIGSITALAGFIGLSGMIAIQFKVFGEIGYSFFGLPQKWSLIIISSIIIFYTVFGGIQSVVKTDVIQLICFFISLPFVGIIFYYIFKEQNSVNIFEVDKFNITKFIYEKDFDWKEMLYLTLYFTIPAIRPDDFQRLTMAFSTKQSRNSYLYSACGVFVISIIILAFPLGLFVINPNLKSNELINTLLTHISYIPFLKVILSLGIISMAMSTADSFLNIGGILISNDFYFFKNFNDEQKLLNTRYCVVGLGIMSIILGLSKNDLLSIVLLSYAFYMPIVTPLILTLIFGFKTTPRCAFLAIGTAFVYVVIFKIILNPNFNIIPLGMLLNITILFSSHFIIEKWELLKCFGITSRLKTIKGAN